MKKRFTILMAACIMLLTIIGLPGKVVGQTRSATSLVALTFPDDNNANNHVGSYTATWTAEIDDYEWSISNFNNNNWSSWTYIKCGNKNTASVGTIINSDAYSEAITKVEVTIDAITTSNVNSIKLYTSSNNSTWTEAGTFEKSTGTKAVTLEDPAADLYYKIAFDCKKGSSGNGYVTVSKVEYFYEGSASTVATPTFSLLSGETGTTLVEDDYVLLDCETDGATIYYTMGNNPADPNDQSEEYDPNEGIEITETTTIKAIAYVGEDHSTVATATYTFPITIAAVRAQATGSVFTKGVITYIDGSKKNAYIQDGTAAIDVYKNTNNYFAGYAVGDKITVTGSLTTYSGGGDLLEITPTTVTRLSQNNPVPYVVKTIAEINQDGFTDLQCMHVKIENAIVTAKNGSNTTISQTVSNVTSTILVYSSNFDVEVGNVIASFDSNVGYYSDLQLINPTNVQSQQNPTITTNPTSMSFSYVSNGSAAAQDLTISGANLEGDITITLSGANFAISADGSDWSHTVLTIPQASANGVIKVRLNSGLNIGDNYTSTITLSSTGVETPVEVSLSGSVTYAVLTYDGNADDVSNVPAAVNCTYEESVEVAGVGSMTRTGYTFAKWNTDQAGHGTDYGPSTSNTSITITQNTTLYAQWTGIPSDINISDMTGGSVIAKVGDAGVEEAPTGETVTLEVSPEPNHVLNTLTVTKGNPSVIVELTQTSANTYTFTMPVVAVTVTATFSESDVYAKYIGTLVEGDYVIAYISDATKKALKNSLTNKKFDGEDITPNGSDQIIDPAASIVWHIAPSGNYWTIYSANATKYAAGTGTKSEAQLLASGTDDKSLFTATLSSEKYTFVNKYNASEDVNAYLRWAGSAWACYAAQSGYECTLYKKVVYPTLAVANNVANGTITATPAGGSAIAEGSSNTVSSGTTIALSATGDTGYVIDAWNVYKDGDQSTKVTVTNNQFTMPDYDVIVSASFRQPTTFTVSYSVNGEIVSTQSNIAEGSPVTLPTDISAPTGYTKVGWTKNEVSAELISTATYTPTDNTTLYLVFVKSGQTAGYNKVTSLNNITPGTYIIVNDNHCLPNVSTGSNGKPAKTDDYTVTNASSTSNYTTVPANTEWFFTGTKTAMTIKNASGDYLYAINDNAGLRVHTTYDTWAFETNSTGFAMKEATNNKYCATYTNDWRSYGTKNHSNYSDGGILYIYKKTPVYTRVYNTTTTTMANIPATSIVTVPNGVTLTLTGTNQGDETNLIIEDGGQLICSNSVKATFNKNITAASTTVVSDENWYLISSPVGTVNTSDVTNLLGSGNHKYNLYKFNETSAAWNGNGGENHFETLAKGMGYLYRNNDGADLSFTGTTVTGDYEYDVELTRHATALPGFNLLGNPYSHNITSKYITLSDDAEFNGCYVLETDGTWTSNLDNVIKPGEGFFVQVSKDATATFHETAQRTGKYNEEYIQFMVSNNDYKDVTFALFDKGIGLKKIDHRNSDVQMVYIKQNNEDYAIATMSDDTKSFDLCFKSKTIGQYTLKYKTHGEFNYIHVIDRMTGEDIDMLVEREYKFISAPKDSENRFIVKLGYLPDYSDVENDIFAFQNGSEILVSGEGELQIFDVTGRNVMTTTINGAESINIPTQGVYIFRLIGTEVKTQKIVVR